MQALAGCTLLFSFGDYRRQHPPILLHDLTVISMGKSPLRKALDHSIKVFTSINPVQGSIFYNDGKFLDNCCISVISVFMLYSAGQ